MLTEPAKPAEPPAGDKPAEEPAKPEPQATYDVTKLTLPEGFEFNDSVKTAFSELTKDVPMSQEVAQKFVDFHTKAINDTVAAVMESIDSRSDAWAKEVRSDKEIGGTNFDATVQTVAKALDVYGAPGVKEALNLTRAGNHPAIVRTFFNMAKALTEGGHVQGGPPGPARPTSHAQAIYPNLPS